MDIEIIQYEPIHAYTILDKDFSNRETWANGWGKEGPAFTLIVDGEIVGCAGVILMEWNKGGEAWTLLSSLFYKYKKTTFKVIKKGLESIIKEKKLKRVQAFVYEGTEKICGNFLEHLGFKNETPDGLKYYGPNNETMFIYSRT